MAAVFSVLYPAMLVGAQQLYPGIMVDFGQLFTQVVGAWLVTMLFEKKGGTVFG